MATHAGKLSGTGTRARTASSAKDRSRRADRRARHVFRTRRVWPAAIAALALTAIGVLTAIEVISALVGSPLRLVPYERVTSWLSDGAWRSVAALVTSGVLVLLGLIALAYALLPGRTRLIPLHGTDPNLLVGVARGGLGNAVEAAAREVSGVDSVSSTKVKRKSVGLTVRTSLRTDDTLGERVRALVQERVDELDPVPPRTVRVNVHRTN